MSEILDIENIEDLAGIDLVQQMLLRDSQIADLRYELRAAHNWISVNEQLPDVGRIVLTREERSYRPPVAALINRDGCFEAWCIRANNFIEGTGLKVTHWIAMPEVSE